MDIPHIIPKKILVPYNFSPLSREAWAFGKHLSSAFSAPLEALYVYEAPQIIVTPLTKDLERRFLSYLHREIGDDAAATIMEGYPTEAIRAFTADHQIDWIVMATHGRDLLFRLLVGSVSETVSRSSPVPVLTLHERWRPIRTILAPVNFESYSLKGFFAAARLAETLKARFDCLFVIEGPYTESLLQTAFEAAIRKLPPYFHGMTPRLLRGSGNPAERIVIIGRDYDLVTMVAHQKSFIRDMTLGTTVERVLRHSTTPVLAIPHGKSVQSESTKKLSAFQAA